MQPEGPALGGRHGWSPPPSAAAAAVSVPPPPAACVCAVNFNELELAKLVGEGSFGQVGVPCASAQRVLGVGGRRGQSGAGRVQSALASAHTHTRTRSPTPLHQTLGSASAVSSRVRWPQPRVVSSSSYCSTSYSSTCPGPVPPCPGNPRPLYPAPMPLPSPAGLAGQVLPDHCGGQGADGAWPAQRHRLAAAHHPAAQPHQGRRPLLRLQPTLSVCPCPHAPLFFTLPPLLLAAASLLTRRRCRWCRRCRSCRSCATPTSASTWVGRGVGRLGQAYCPLQRCVGWRQPWGGWLPLLTWPPCVPPTTPAACAGACSEPPCLIMVRGGQTLCCDPPPAPRPSLLAVAQRRRGVPTQLPACAPAASASAITCPNTPRSTPYPPPPTTHLLPCPPPSGVLLPQEPGHHPRRSQQRPPTVQAALLATAAVHGHGCRWDGVGGWVVDGGKPRCSPAVFQDPTRLD